jgi:hypothetical protein
VEKPILAIKKKRRELRKGISLCRGGGDYLISLSVFGKKQS